MIFNSIDLIITLKEYVLSHTKFIEELKAFSEEDLQRNSNKESWSILECLEHLNLYANFYNKEIKKRLENSNHSTSNVFKSGFLGNKFASDLLPKNGMKTMNTFKSKNPIHSYLKKEEVLRDFVSNQEELLCLLTVTRSKNLTKIKTSLTIPLLRFRLGDTFRFVIYHNERHVVQARGILRDTILIS